MTKSASLSPEIFEPNRAELGVTSCVRSTDGPGSLDRPGVNAIVRQLVTTAMPQKNPLNCCECMFQVAGDDSATGDSVLFTTHSG
jgi:hypothetical protein